MREAEHVVERLSAGLDVRTRHEVKEVRVFLPTAKARAIQRLGMGYFEKIAMHFPEPFWANQGYSYLAYGAASGAYEFPLFIDYQSTFGEPVLVGFTSGAYARSTGQMTRREIRTRALGILSEAYGAIPEPDDVVITRWGSDPHSAGAYSFFPEGAGVDDIEALSAPAHGRLLFAGEATSAGRGSTADGAFSTGVREVRRLLDVPSARIAPL